MKKLLFFFVVACCMLSFSCSNKTAKGKSVASDDAHTSANSR